MARKRPDIALVWIGKTSAAFAVAGVDEYLERIRRYRSCRRLVVAEERHDGKYSVAHRLEREGKAILERVGTIEPAYAVAVDPQGRQLDSREFAEMVRRCCYEDTRSLALIVGGPDGLGPGVRERADRILSLGALTLSHDLARLVLIEQLYRAFTIIHGHPYAR